jgi:uncharacterized tellurite resistance protein B-like protein
MEELIHSISYLFYAVAHADRNVDESEKQKIHQVVNENWQLLVTKGDPFGVHAVELIDKMVEQLAEEEYDNEKALGKFKECLEKHPEFFTPEMKQFIQEVCIRTANAFNMMNKSELTILTSLEKILHD